MQAEANGAVGIILEPQIAVERDDFGPAGAMVWGLRHIDITCLDKIRLDASSGMVVAPRKRLLSTQVE